MQRSKLIRERARRVERKKEPHPNHPGIEIIEKILAVPDNSILIFHMLQGLVRGADPRADTYLHEYFEKITGPAPFYDFEQLLEVPPTTLVK